jgi:hypothetical protein
MYTLAQLGLSLASKMDANNPVREEGLRERQTIRKIQIRLSSSTSFRSSTLATSASAQTWLSVLPSWVVGL